jgi:hypothetical protein
MNDSPQETLRERLELSEYKQQIADLYSGRSAGYDNGIWHPRIAHRLVEYANIQPGQKVLDLATGTVEKCHDLLYQAGFESIDIKTEPEGKYISLEKAQSMWAGNPSFPTPGQYPNPLLQLTSEQLVQAKVDFDAELERLQTPQGIWDDGTIFYVFGQKAVSC